MDIVRHRHDRHHYYCFSSAMYIFVFTFLVVSSAAASAFTFTSQKHQAKTKKTLQENSSLEPSRELNTQELKWEASQVNFLDHGMAQKRATGPGSSPPSCRSKCGRCKPCKPVHVPIQPGMSIPLEYYPEAWRCKCGNKLFMP